MKQLFHIVPEGSTGTRRAVMIGINYTGQDGELSGCQNDVKNVSSSMSCRSDLCHSLCASHWFTTKDHHLILQYCLFI